MPNYRDIYLNTLVKAAETWGDANGWAAQEFERQYNLIRTPALDDPHKQCLAGTNPGPCTPGAFENEIANMRMFLAGRRSSVLSQVASAQGNPIIESEPFVESVASRDAPGAQLVPGSMAVLGGYNLGPTANASGETLPRSLAGTTVAIDGERVPLQAVTPSQIVFQVPIDLKAGSASVVVHVNELLSTSKQIVIADISSARGSWLWELTFLTRRADRYSATPHFQRGRWTLNR